MCHLPKEFAWLPMNNSLKLVKITDLLNNNDDNDEEEYPHHETINNLETGTIQNTIENHKLEYHSIQTNQVHSQQSIHNNPINNQHSAKNETIYHFSEANVDISSIDSSSLKLEPVDSKFESKPLYMGFSSFSYLPLHSNYNLNTLHQHIGNHKYTRYQINPKFIPHHDFIKIAIRRKVSSTKTVNTNTISKSRLRTKYLEARLTVNLTYVKNLTILYNHVFPHSSKKDILSIYLNPLHDTFIRGTSQESNDIIKNPIKTRKVQLIDKNLVNIASYPNRLLDSNLKNQQSTKTPGRSRSKNSPFSVSVPTFNCLDTAFYTFFGIKDYSIIRITRSTIDDIEGSVILKLETVAPGDLSLIDDPELAQEMFSSLGTIGSIPLNVFIKKIVARPRYKSNMKIYLLPNKLHFSLYTDARMFKRDLMNGIIDLQLSEEEIKLTRIPDHDFKLIQPSQSRTIYVTFPYGLIIEEFKQLVRISLHDQQFSNIPTES